MRLLPVAAALVALSAGAGASPSSPSPESRESHLLREQTRIEKQLEADKPLQRELEKTISHVQGMLAELDGDMAEERRIFQQALDTASEAWNKLQARRKQDQRNLKTIGNAITLQRECMELEARAERDRRALQRQMGASELSVAASEAQPALIAARTGMAAARLAILANQFSKYNRLMMEMMDNAQFLARHATELSPVPVAVPQMKDMSLVWNGLNAARSADECKDQIKGWFTYSHLLQNAIAVGKCVEALDKAAQFLQVHGTFLKKAGNVLGVVVPAAEFAHEVRQLRDDLQGLHAHAVSHPESALRAANVLDEQQKSTLQSLSRCNASVTETLKDLR
jgi:hypothetical protein